MKKLLAKLMGIYRGMSAPVKASFWFLICNVVQAGIGVLAGMIFARIMSEEEYGALGVFNSWKSILMVFSSLNLSYGVFNNAMLKYEDSKTRDEYVSSMEALYGIITAFITVFYVIFHDWCNARLGMTTPVAVMMILELFFCPALLFWSSRQRFEFKYRSLVTVTIIMSVLNIVLGVIFVLLSENKTEARIFSQVLVDVIFCGYLFVYQLIKGKKLFIPKFWKFALAFNIPLVPHYLSEILLNMSDRIMIEKIVDDVAAAKYTVAYGVPSLMQLFMNAVNASFLPWAYSKIRGKKYRDIGKMANTMMIFMFVLVLFVMLLAPELLLILAGKKYADSVYVIPPLAISVLFLFFYDMYSTVEFYFGENIGVMVASIVSAVLNVILNLIFISKFGYEAAAYTTMTCYMFYALAHYVFYRYTSRKHLEGAKVFDGGVMFITAAVAVGIMFIVNAVYGNILIRYILMAIIVITAIIKRGYIISKFNEMKNKE